MAMNYEVRHIKEAVQKIDQLIENIPMGWDDIKTIVDIADDVLAEWIADRERTEFTDDEYYTEVFNRFNKQS